MNILIILLVIIVIIVIGLRFLTTYNGITVMSYNIEYGAEEYSINDVITIIKNSDADVIVLQETVTNKGNNVTHDIAKKLGWNYCCCRNQSAVISRLPVEIVDSENCIVSVGGKWHIASVHFTDYPYQPFEVEGIKYCYDKCDPAPDNAYDLAHLSDEVRTKYVEILVNELKKYKNVFIVGDFNEPSHLDWTERAVKAGICKKAIPFQCSTVLAESGYKDSYRSLYPDEVKFKGITWPSRHPGYSFRSDRIDFIYSKMVCVAFKRVMTNSDHLAIVARFIVS